MATAIEIQRHYDIDVEFYLAFLDRWYQAYSCGVWTSATTLEEAQEAKIDWMWRCAGIRPGSRVLDVGCGWGGALRRALDHFEVGHAHGLTLSRRQRDFVLANQRADLTVDLSSWEEHVPARRYDAVLCVGAMEHFASLEDRRAGRHRARYRRFFEWCLSASTLEAELGLQTIVTARLPRNGQEMRDTRYLLEKVFSGSALPTVTDIQSSAADLYEIGELRRIGPDYVKTLRCWSNRLNDSRDSLVAAFGAERYEHFQQYFAAAERLFTSGVADLVQVSLRRADAQRCFR